MEKISVGANVFTFPMPVALLGCMVDGRANFMALGWMTRVNANPPLIGVGVGNHHHTTKGLRESKAFSINYPGADMRVVTDYCGIVSGKSEDKSAAFTVFYGLLGNVPMIAECTLSLECRVVQEVPFKTNTFFIGEIVESYTEERYLTGNSPDIKKMNPLLLTMPDNNYWTVGEHAGRAWKDGSQYKKK